MAPFAIFQHDLDPLLGLGLLQRFRTSTNRYPSLHKRLRQLRSDIGIACRHELGQQLDHGRFSAQRVVDIAKLQSDRTPPDRQKALGNF